MLHQLADHGLLHLSQRACPGERGCGLFTTLPELPHLAELWHVQDLGSQHHPNCIETAGQAIVSQTAGEVVHASIRTPWIKVYRSQHSPQRERRGRSGILRSNAAFT